MNTEKKPKKVVVLNQAHRLCAKIIAAGLTYIIIGAALQYLM